ncbi:MAG: acetyl-CoA carboxylase carboxyltransferase subunit [Myxococcales bacterium]|nr:acetyl-CoA carboxylase carboxyltransferase subunit [Myxococcales bacterium]MCB9630162.1 acetyl-CoA carboxylase carboxyltransferase subunit [Sandaracinaceae bacterium]
MSEAPNVAPILTNPLAPPPEVEEKSQGPYDDALAMGQELRDKPRSTPTRVAVGTQHGKGRMTVWERIDTLKDPGDDPTILFQNWGKNLDGASIVTGVAKVNGKDVAFYGHDFTLRAGSMDATNGRKLANVMRLAGERGIPLVGMNDSAGAYVPAGIGGLDGYAEAFTALRKISGRVPSVMCMFGFNAGGGAYLPRQGSFVIQPEDTFFGLTGPGVVKSVLGEDVTPDELGGPGVHGQSGVADLTVADEVGALRTARRLLSYLPSSNEVAPPFQATSDALDRPTQEIETLLRKAFNSPTGFNTPIDVSILIQQICDHGDYFEIQPQRARNTITAFGRLGGHVVGIVANNSAVSSGQIDVAAALKNARFIRFCNIYNIPVVFMEDTTGFLPGRDQEMAGIVQAGRAMLDSIIDLRTPRLLMIIRNAFGGAYAAFNCYATGADHVIALPTTRVAVMGPAGKEFVYKTELRAVRAKVPGMVRDAVAAGKSEADAKAEADAWLKAQEAGFNAQYERELMNPKEALSLGSISEIVMPRELRANLIKSLNFYLSTYKVGPMQSVQRESF